MSLFERIAAAARPAGMAVVGESVSYVPAGGVAEDVTVIWSEDQARLPEGVQGMAWGAEADFPSGTPAKNDRIVRGGVTYRVVEPIVRDGQGGVTLHLRLARD